MPRKTRKPRTAVSSSMPKAQHQRQVIETQPKKRPFGQNLQRQQRPDMRPPRFPGRLGGR